MSWWQYKTWRSQPSYCSFCFGHSCNAVSAASFIVFLIFVKVLHLLVSRIANIFTRLEMKDFLSSFSAANVSIISSTLSLKILSVSSLSSSYSWRILSAISLPISVFTLSKESDFFIFGFVDVSTSLSISLFTSLFDFLF